MQIFRVCILLLFCILVQICTVCFAENEVVLCYNAQEYVPCHESVASKLSWQMEQLGYPQDYDISR